MRNLFSIQKQFKNNNIEFSANAMLKFPKILLALFLNFSLLCPSQKCFEWYGTNTTTFKTLTQVGLFMDTTFLSNWFLLKKKPLKLQYKSSKAPPSAKHHETGQLERDSSKREVIIVVVVFQSQCTTAYVVSTPILGRTLLLNYIYKKMDALKDKKMIKDRKQQPQISLIYFSCVMYPKSGLVSKKVPISALIKKCCCICINMIFTTVALIL